MNTLIDMEAEVTFLKPSEGGRSKPVFQGFRPTFVYNDTVWDAHIQFKGDDFIPDGISRNLFFTFASPEFHIGKIIPGKLFELHDGRVIATGKVLRIIDLEQSANNSINARR
jgi:translation elongation factor EF-Tu-like GTPase